MTQYFYSPETKGFYIGSLHQNIPADAIEIEESLYAELIQAQHAGKMIVFEDENLATQDLNFDIGWDRIRTIRNKLMFECDWVFSEDSPLTDELKAQWRIYRKELRDLPATFDDPSKVVWPIPPTSN